MIYPSSYVYIKTDIAYYILDDPDSEYEATYEPFWKAHRLFHLFVLAARLNTAVTKEEFLRLVRKARKTTLQALPRLLCPRLDALPMETQLKARNMASEFAVLVRKASASLCRPFETDDMCTDMVVCQTLAQSHPQWIIDIFYRSYILRDLSTRYRTFQNYQRNYLSSFMCLLCRICCPGGAVRLVSVCPSSLIFFPMR